MEDLPSKISREVNTIRCCWMIILVIYPVAPVSNILVIVSICLRRGVLLVCAITETLQLREETITRGAESYSNCIFPAGVSYFGHSYHVVRLEMTDSSHSVCGVSFRPLPSSALLSDM